MKDNKGFTLLELLVVIIIMAILMGLGVPAVIKIIENKGNDQYSMQIKMTEEAVKLYETRYKGEFSNNPNSTCFALNYQILKDEGLINENDVNCTGKVVLTKTSKNNFKRQYFLKCIDKKNVKFSDYNEGDVPTGCINLGTNAVTPQPSAITPPTITGGNSNWVATNTAISVSNSGIDAGDVSKYEYYTSTNSTAPTRSTVITGTGSSVNITADGTTYVWFRVVDKSGNVSAWSNREIVNKDTVNPAKPTITASDGVATNANHVADTEFVLNFTGGTNISGNDYYYGYDSNNVTTLGSSLKVLPADVNKTIYVKSCSGAGVCSAVNSYTVKYAAPVPED